MECQAHYSILGADNIFARIGIDPCVINVLEIALSACVFGVFLLAIHHAASAAFTWYRWISLKISTHSFDESYGAESNQVAIETTGSSGSVN
mgnify:CR=1 FL=1|jgi:hypothetical protein